MNGETYITVTVVMFLSFFITPCSFFKNPSVVDLQYCMFQVHSKVIQCLYIYIYIYIYIFQIIFPCRLLQDTECCSLCYAVNPSYLSILYIALCIC